MFPYQISDRGVTVFIDSKPRQFAVTHSQYSLIVEAIHAGDELAVRTHTDVAKSINLQTEGRVRIENDCVFVGDRQVHGNIADRILAMVVLKSKAIDGLVKFLDRVYDNVSKSVLDELFDFIEACDLPITDDGCFLTYKFVNSNYTDCHSGTFDNSVGATPSMPRNEVDDRRNVTCSDGLHVCSLEYLSNKWGDRVMVCKVAPEDVVSVPLEYGNAKMRVCQYTVVAELDFDGGERIKPWFDNQYDSPESDDSEGEDEVEDDGVNSDILLFIPDDVAASLDSLGADESAIQIYLETLDDELVEQIYDWDIVTGSDGDVQVTIWLDNEVIGLEHTVMAESTDDDEVSPNSDILIFSPDDVAAALNAIGGDKAAIQAYLEVLDDELVEPMSDWDIVPDSDGDLQVTIWLDDDVIGLDHIIFVSTPATPVPTVTKQRGNAKLTAEQVREIKRLKDDWAAGNITLTAIGKQYGVHREQIARIFRGDTWSHIT